MNVRFSLYLLLLTAVMPLSPRASEFSVLTYNVENLFDVDGVALFDEYVEEADGTGYSPRKLLTKLRNITFAVQQFDGGRGPDIIVFQEFELDRTPHSTVPDYGRFLKRYHHKRVDEMLMGDPAEEVRGLPVEALLLKHFEENGLRGYFVAKPALERDLEAYPAHNNVVFSRFPILKMRQFPTEEARDILEVELDVAGFPLIILNNHWKSGASNPDRESIRVQNAKVLRSRLNEILLENPFADVILAGDFNSHYNHDAYMRGKVEVTGINSILRSQGDELAVARDRGAQLYNLWFEVAPEERGTEVWGGRWGTLMQMLITPGLYDYNGIQYVDNSFGVLRLEGINAGRIWGRPKEWHPLGDGGGFSDHFPIYARFRIVPDNDTSKRLRLKAPADGEYPNPLMPQVDFKSFSRQRAADAQTLVGLDDRALGERIGEVFHVKGKLLSTNPFRVSVGGREFGLWSHDRDLRDRLMQLGEGAKVEFLGDLGSYRGQIQFVIRDPAWML